MLIFVTLISQMTKMDAKDVNIEALRYDFERYQYDYDLLVSKWIIERVPYIFNDDRDLFLKTKNTLSKLINVDSCSIIFVGSSCVGFSMNPYKQFKAFDINSDIDIAVISHYYFDIAWHTIRNIDYFAQPPVVQQAISDHRTGLLYWGTIATDKILGLLPFGVQWLNAIETLKKDGVFENRDVNFRLYRDHESLRSYHSNNLKKNMLNLLGVQPESVTLE